ncbi:hypothetical protein CNMCM8980_008424 [Aspergillus fumigatiaffinis]|nr:hypothetical protein CNMCM8980_008424 [Aspergillus fumigatiaffinis]
MKFLEEQREKGGTDADDLSNPRWRAAVDAWIPTWQRWEEAEARRIERRDLRARKSRKRKDRSFDLWDGNSDGWRPSATPVVESRFQAPGQGPGQSQPQQAQPPSVSPASPPVPAASTGVGAGAGATPVQNIDDPGGGRMVVPAIINDCSGPIRPGKQHDDRCIGDSGETEQTPRRSQRRPSLLPSCYLFDYEWADRSGERDLARQRRGRCSGLNVLGFHQPT